MLGIRIRRTERILDPVARTSEILFGLIMALTLTGTLSVATAGREDVRTLLIGVLGCNFAWGIADAVMHLMSAFGERGHDVITLREVRRAKRPEDAYPVIAGAIPPLLASILKTDDFETIRQGLLRMDEPPSGAAFVREDWLGALGVFLLVFVSTFPVVVPFLVLSDVRLALRLSNLVAIVMLFMAGGILARHGGLNPVRTGLTVVLLGVLLVVITMALGG
ncbi:MAG TPA: hypothetical protein VH458_16170 [Vicinamibacterales bacterium]|jgi:VIT1/CCC1 family predicted Fe2+/Mn2+ transporter